MLHLLEQTQGKLIATKATGKLTKQDYKKLLPVMNSIANGHDKVNWYFEMEDFEGWDLGGFWEDLRFDFEHAQQFEKIAMVGNEKWEKRISDLMRPFTSAKVMFFKLEQRELALGWITE